MVRSIFMQNAGFSTVFEARVPDRGIELDVFGAILAGDEARVRELIRSGASLVKSYTHEGWTPLHDAAFFGYGPCAYLISQGADLNTVSQNEIKNTPLHAAAAGNDRRIAAELTAGARLDAPGRILI